MKKSPLGKQTYFALFFLFLTAAFWLLTLTGFLILE